MNIYTRRILSNIFFILYAISEVQGENQRNNGTIACNEINRPNITFACTPIKECHIPVRSHIQCESDVSKICCPTIRHTEKKHLTTMRQTNGKRQNRATASTTSRITKRVTTTATTPKTTPAKPIAVKADPITVARQKCIEYAEARYTKRILQVPLGQKPREVKDLDCIDIDSLIVGGKPAVEKEFPHMALIGYRDQLKNADWLCGGSLISDQYILSAGHCAVSSALGPAKWAALGLLKRNEVTPDKLNTNIFAIVQYLTHPQYKPPIQDHDIALFKLEKPITLNPKIRPICLFTSAELPVLAEREKATISGWGKTSAAEIESEVLLKAKIDFLESNSCQSTYGSDSKLKSGFDGQRMVCAGDTHKSTDTCEGDSGGPLQVPYSGFPCMWSQVGITSLGVPFCGDRSPAIYTKISYYVPWIQSVVWH